jgi:hypothetical protein
MIFRYIRESVKISEREREREISESKVLEIDGKILKQYA